MNVRELIDALDEFGDHLEVVVEVGDNEYDFDVTSGDDVNGVLAVVIAVNTPSRHPDDA